MQEMRFGKHEWKYGAEVDRGLVAFKPGKIYDVTKQPARAINEYNQVKR
jgi:hypothetical protein